MANNNSPNNSIYVDVNSTNCFTESDLKTYNRLIVEEAHPWLFGDDLLPSLKVVSKASLVDMDSVNWLASMTEQTPRVGSKNPKLKQIALDIGTFGFKLTAPAICLFRAPNGELTPLNGRTRREILVVNHRFTNCIAIIFEGREGFSEDEILDDCSAFGLLSNSHEDPAGDLQLEDVYREVCLAIDRGWCVVKRLPNSEGDDIQSIRDRVDRVCGKGCFTPTKREQLVYRIFNTYSVNYVVKSWSTKGAAQAWMQEKKYINVGPTNGKRGIKYICLSAETGTKSLITAAKVAAEAANRDYDIRVVVHTGTLTGYDLAKCYVDKVTKLREFWYNTLNELSFSYFGEARITDSPITLYGALPALSSIHNLDKLVLFETPGLNNSYGLIQKDEGDEILFDFDSDAHDTKGELDFFESEETV